MLLKNVIEMLLFYFQSLKQRRPLMAWIPYRLRQENYKNTKVKMEMRREGKKVAVHDGTESFYTIYIRLVLLEIQQNIF